LFSVKNTYLQMANRFNEKYKLEAVYQMIYIYIK